MGEKFQFNVLIKFFLKWLIGGLGFSVAIVFIFWVLNYTGIFKENQEPVTYYIPAKNGIEISESHLVKGREDLTIGGTILTDSTLKSDIARIEIDIFVDSLFAGNVESKLNLNSSGTTYFAIDKHDMNPAQIKNEITWEIKDIDIGVDKKTADKFIEQYEK